ncbi:MAG: transporter [Alphaproteobacteria bacterium]|jgi:hypothetical protein|nr:transporter [Alphaproteobacteria bacterium]
MNRLIKTIMGGVGALSLSAVASGAVAQAIDAGDYIPAPSGVQLGIVYAQFSHAGSLYSNGDRVDGDAELDSAISIFRYVAYTKLAGMTFDYQVIQPYGHVEAGGSVDALGSATGFADTIFVATLWPIENHETGTYLGISPYIYAPTGEYDADKAINLGENRWRGVLQAVLSQKLSKKWVGEIAGDVTLYGDNDDNAAGRLEQDPTWRVQAFARYLIDGANEANLRLMYVRSGETQVAGIDRNDDGGTWSAMATWRHDIRPTLQLMTQVGTDLDIDNGFKEDARLQFRLVNVF